MTHVFLADDVVAAFREQGEIVVVGASLAGLRAAEALREQGFRGSLTLIGDEPHEPYDRPPLSKQVLKGWVPADHTKLPRMRAIDADWRLGVAATGLDRANLVGVSEEFLGVVEGVGAGLAVVGVVPASGWGGGIHSVRPLARLRVVQPPGLSSRWCGPQAKVRLSMSVR